MTFAEIKTHFNLLTQTNSSFPDASLTVLLKKAQARVVSLIHQADGRFDYDDNNQADFPIATTAIVSGQSDYSLAVSHLAIKRAEIKDSNGTWYQLSPYDNQDYPGQSITQRATQTGLPIEYDKLGSSVILWPTPNYSQAASLKLYYDRGPLEFSYVLGTFTDASGSTSSSPGFNSLYHSLLSFLMAYDYAITKLPQLVPGYRAEIQSLEAALLRDYGARDKDDPPRMTMRPILFK